MTMADPVDLDVLDRYLLSDEAPDNGMALSDLDGFLTGILVGPELIMPSEWLPHIWGGEPPKFAKHARLILSTIMGRYNEIAAALEAGPDAFERDQQHEPYRASAKPGRNMPCPCGSGR